MPTYERAVGPQVPFSEQIAAEKHRGPGESFREAVNRQANALKDDDDHFHEFREVLMGQRFLPAGRIQTAVGSTKIVTPYNCFVSGTIEDSFVDGHGNIMERAKEAAATMRMGGGIGYDFSTLRPRGALIKKLASRSSGPIPFMGVFDAVGLATASSGHRRGAQMGCMRIDHPDVEEFIHAKQNLNRLTGFNLSILVTDQFMECLSVDRPFPLRWGGEVHREVDPSALWEMVMRSTWDYAEPGVLFVDTINRMNNLWYCETISATNPCGEQPLPPYGACLLGSFNLPKYIKGLGERRSFDMDQFLADIPPVVRAMDNVPDRATYPLYEQEKEAKAKRRMGLGVTGLANALEALGLPYGSDGFVTMEGRIMEALKNAAYRASALLAEEKGHFPAYDARYLQGEFIRGLDADVRDLIARHGVRNSHLTSVAPTGTISLAADNVSSGLEPVFAYSTDRQVVYFEGPRVERVEDYGVRVFGVRGRQSGDVTADEHLAVLLAAQRHVDSAISKTCNVPSDMPWDDFGALYIKAWEGGAKGCTTYQVGGKRAGVLVAATDDTPSEGATCFVDGVTGMRDCG